MWFLVFCGLAMKISCLATTTPGTALYVDALHAASPSVPCLAPPSPLHLIQAPPTDSDTPPSPAEGDMQSSGRSAQYIALCWN